MSNEMTLEEKLMFSESDNDMYRDIIEKSRSAIQELYALRGEDPVVSRLCNVVIDLTRSI